MHFSFTYVLIYLGHKYYKINKEGYGLARERYENATESFLMYLLYNHNRQKNRGGIRYRTISVFWNDTDNWSQISGDNIGHLLSLYCLNSLIGWYVKSQMSADNIGHLIIVKLNSLIGRYLKVHIGRWYRWTDIGRSLAYGYNLLSVL